MAEQTTTLYHATRTLQAAHDIARDGFRGNCVWDLDDVVFVADRPLSGFGQWDRDQWVAIEVPTDRLADGTYAQQDEDNAQYDAICYAFPAGTLNQFARWIEPCP